MDTLPDVREFVNTTGPESWPIMIGALHDFLLAKGYDALSRQQICYLAQQQGHLAEAVERLYLDREDLADAEATLADDQTEVPFDDDAWEDNSIWELGPPIPPDAELLPPELDDDDDLFEDSDLDYFACGLLHGQPVTLPFVPRISAREYQARHSLGRID